ncbi:tripartite tricarboxylate transporter substrate binding protein [Limnohabitans sp. Rim8]|uniref:Bug family tripartite tricarboxylate transporter substrate binding protein n=1 Tax=Limnohabitans sp. Rim8 TaxID=1100718 RepID=UPI0025E92E18|nr:tripartite tricarboxylate transporter substrate binding protein [Limnohabitans sp. Rim8]
MLIRPSSLALSRRLALALLGALALSPAVAQTDNWPTKPIRMVVPFPAGGGTDIIAREVTQKMAATNKWTFVIDNKPGSGGNIGIDNAAKSSPDGYSLVIGQTSNLAINPSLYSKLPYDPIKDLTPIGLIGNAALVVVVATNSPFRNLGDVINAAKAQPGFVNYATSGNGTVAHLATELLQREANVKLTHIPYKGAAQGINDVIGGQVQVYVSSVPTLIGHIKSGKLRPLAVTSSKRVDDLPQTPTVAESGYKGFDAVTWFGLLGPAKLPAALVANANVELNKALNSPDLRKKLEDQGLTVTPTSSSEFGQLIQGDIAKWAPVVKGSGAKVD